MEDWLRCQTRPLIKYRLKYCVIEYDGYEDVEWYLYNQTFLMQTSIARILVSAK